jgi:hypothetical protein
MTANLNAALLALAVTTIGTPALADDDLCNADPRDIWISEEEIAEKAEALGYQVRAVSVESGCWEIQGADDKDQGHRIYFDPLTGEIVRHDRTS